MVRRFVALKGIAKAALLLAAGLMPAPALAQSQPPKPDHIVINDSGGAMQSAMRKIFYSEFEQRNGVKILNTSPIDLGKLKAMVTTGNVEWAVTELTGEEAVLAEKQGLLEKLDHEIVTFDGYPDALKSREYIFPKSVYSTVMGYRTDVFKDGAGPKSWADFFDLAKFPGPRTMQNSPTDNLEFALLADGVPLDKLYPLDVDRAFRKLDTIKKSIAVWWTTGAQSAQVMVDKEVVMGTAWNGRYWTLIKQNAPLAMVWNGGAMKESAFVIPKGAKDAYWGQKFLALASEAKAQGVYAEMLGYPGLNLKAMQYTDPKILPFLPTYPEHFSKQFWTDMKWWSENGPAVKARWDRWVLEK
jgi:putative spermidine/putrescine transport system substrate-binding protein